MKMDNMKELDMKDLGRISGGKLSEWKMNYLNNIIKGAKENGVSLNDLLEGSFLPDIQEYLRAHW